ncbi:hypothetical protein HK099_008276 [Clydaea vesicula]|uniref:Cytochrome P450 n=1 Tax=Clydaea vesicula TaxID=447962 RepID=A0AAD5XY02_9FUNG|nr:hypothetical protein HK099_008276 [Clydaea vesicula]
MENLLIRANIKSSKLIEILCSKSYLKLSLLSFTSIYFLTKLLNFTKEKIRLRNKKLPPVKKGNFLTKNFFEARKYVMEDNFHLFIKNLNEEHSITRFEVPVFVKGVSVSDASAAKDILCDTNRFNRAEVLGDQVFEGLIKKALFMLNGNLHKKHRKMLQPGFSPSHLKIAFETSKECCHRLFKAFKMKNIKEIDVYDYFKYISIDVIGKTVFSYDFQLTKDLDIETSKYDSLRQLEKMNVALQKRALPRFLWRYYGITVSQMEKEAKGIQDTVTKVIEHKKEKLQNREPSSIVGKWGMDVLDRLLENSSEIGEDKEKPFTTEELRDEVLGFYFAGLGTTTDSLSLAVLDIFSNPRVVKKLREEVDEAFNKKDGFTYENLNNMKYIDCVIKECQRLHPIALLLLKQAVSDTELHGYFIKKNTLMVINVISMHTDVKYWGADAEEFKPERWRNGFVPVPGSYIPFSDGGMNCIAQKLAIIEMKVVLAEMIRTYDINLVPEQDLRCVVIDGRVGPRNGIKIYFEERNY